MNTSPTYLWGASFSLGLLFFTACSDPDGPTAPATLPTLDTEQPAQESSHSPDIDFPDFSSTAGLNLVLNATQVGNALRLTFPAGGQGGAAWFTTKQSVAPGFTTTFDFQITAPGGIFDPLGSTGADGLAFVVQNTSVSELGVLAIGMGYTNILNSLAVEFDTWYNIEPGVNDPNGNHVSVHTGGTGPNSVLHSFSLGSTTAIPNMSDGNVHTVTIDYTPGTMNVFMDNPNVPVLSVPVDLATTLSLENGRKAFVGFVASTGAAWENHDILNWSLVTSPMPVDIDIRPNVDPNLIDLDADRWLPVLIITTPSFDAADVDPATVTLSSGDGNSTGVAPKGWAPGLRTELADLDGDGDDDRVLVFSILELVDNDDLDEATTALVLNGTLTDGTDIQGMDAVQITTQ